MRHGSGWITQTVIDSHFWTWTCATGSLGSQTAPVSNLREVDHDRREIPRRLFIVRQHRRLAAQGRHADHWPPVRTGFVLNDRVCVFAHQGGQQRLRAMRVPKRHG